MEWINIKEKQPPIRETVLGYFPDGTEGGNEVSTAIWTGTSLHSDFPNSTAYCFKATHWMFFPDPPSDGV
jgi:hypothetical protein